MAAEILQYSRSSTGPGYPGAELGRCKGGPGTPHKMGSCLLGGYFHMVFYRCILIGTPHAVVLSSFGGSAPPNSNPGSALVAIHKAKEDNFFTILSKENEDVNQLATKKPHRAALQFCTLTKDGVYSDNTRSLLCFCSEEYPRNASGFRLLNYSSFRLLRVLTIEYVEGLDALEVFGFKRYCYIQQEIFKKISSNNLETVDLKESRGTDKEDTDKEEATDWSSDVVIPNLRHLFVSVLQCFPLKWDHHTNLQTLKYVDNCVLPKLGCCINLRTLGIHYPKGRVVRLLEEWQTLKSVLTRTKQLVSLSILNADDECFLPFGGTRDLPCHEKIQSLYLQGEWGKDIWLPCHEMFPTNLTKLVLEYSRLEEDPMHILENLQSLRILRLLFYSYMGTKLICSTGGFLNYLEKLELVELLKLSHLDVKEGAMPILSHLKIMFCDELRTLPELPNVQIERDNFAKEFDQGYNSLLINTTDNTPAQITGIFTVVLAKRFARLLRGRQQAGT